MNRFTRLKHAIVDKFSTAFGYSAKHVFQAPGRVNLIGEHTDYNDGFVLPCAIDFQTMVAISPRPDNTVRVIASDYHDQQDEFDLTQPIKLHPDYQWANYIRGVLKCFLARELTLQGADLVVSGNVPQGAGLSSSAALEVVIGQAFKTICHLDVSQQEIALLGQQAENEFVGCNCGIMDQLISAKSQANHATLLDCRTLETRPVKMPSGISIAIINSNVKRGLVDSEYNARRTQCEQAANIFNVKALRDLDLPTFSRRSNELDPIVARRARHVISENSRTLAAETALAEADMKTLGRLMAESHHSMRVDFEITVPQIDLLVDTVKKVVNDDGGVRMTGGGFGGCVVALFPEHYYELVCNAILNQYQRLTGLTADIYICRAMSGASEIIE